MPKFKQFNFNFATKLFGCLLFAAPLTATAENITSIYDLAYKNDPTFQAAKQNYLANKQSVPLAIAGLLPSLDAFGTTSSIDAPNVSSNDFNTHSIGLSLSQPIYQHQLWVRLFQAKNTVKQSLATFLAAEQDLILRTSEAYFAVLAARDALGFAETQRKAFARQLEQAQQRFKVGLIAITDVHEAQASYDSALAQEISAANILEDSYEVLREITGMAHSSLADLKRLELEPPTPNDIEAWVEQAKKSNYNVQAAKFGVAVAKQEIAFSRAGHYPIFDLNAELSKDKGARPLTNDVTNKSLTFGVAVPLFRGGGVLADTKRARASYREAQYNFDTLYRNVISTTRQSYRGVITQIGQVKALSQAVTSSRSALEASEAAYEVGTRTIVDVLDAQSNLFNAENAHSQARYDYILEGLRLKLAAGTLSRDDILQVNTLLDD